MIAVCIFICCVVVVFGDYCGENKVPFGLEVHRNGQPSLLCARPNCNERKFLDCEDHAIRSSCPENNTIVGGFDKGYGNHQPLYLLCCVFDDLIYSVPLYNSIVVHPGEYFEGEEQVEEQSEAIKSFDVITSMKLIDDPNTTIAYEIDVRRVLCTKSISKRKKKRLIQWP